MYGIEARNQKQEIDRQRHAISNRRSQRLQCRLRKPHILTFFQIKQVTLCQAKMKMYQKS